MGQVALRRVQSVRTLVRPHECVRGGEYLQSGDFAEDCLDPSLDEGICLGYATDRQRCLASAEIGLVEHERVVIEAEEVACVGILLQRKECSEVARSG